MLVFDDAASAALPEARRQTLVEHLDQAGVAEEVAVPDASVLPSLLVEGSPRALEACGSAPNVKEVVPVPDDVSFKAL